MKCLWIMTDGDGIGLNEPVTEVGKILSSRCIHSMGSKCINHSIKVMKTYKCLQAQIGFDALVWTCRHKVLSRPNPQALRYSCSCTPVPTNLWVFADGSGLQSARTLVMEISSHGVDVITNIRRVLRYRQMKKWVMSKSKYGVSISPHGKMRKKDGPCSGNGKTGFHYWPLWSSPWSSWSRDSHNKKIRFIQKCRWESYVLSMIST